MLGILQSETTRLGTLRTGTGAVKISIRMYLFYIGPYRTAQKKITHACAGNSNKVLDLYIKSF